MFILDSPSLTDNLPAWYTWIDHLEKLAFKHKLDKTIMAEKRRAKRVVQILEEYPNGLDITSPNFCVVVKKLSAL